MAVGFPNLSRTVQGRAIRQASANTESNEAVVVRTYADASGNITAADVRVKGQVAPLVRVPNVSGLKLYVGASVEARFVNGSKHYRTITGASGSSTSLATAATSTSPPAAPAPPGPLLDQSPVLLQSADTLDTPGGYVEAPGANVLFTDTPPGAASGGLVNGQRLITARPLVAPSLPSPLTTTLPDGTLLDLVDSYGGPLGMYRLDAGARTWRRRDAGGGSLSLATASAFGTVETDITETGGSVVYTKTTSDSKFATQSALTTEANARTSADTTLQNNITAEATARASGDALALQKASNLSDVASAGTARTNLGLGTAATLNAPASGNATSAQVVLGSDTRLGNATRYWFLAGDSVTPPAANTTDPVYTFRLPKSPTGAALTYTLTDCNFHAAVSPGGGPATLDFYKNGATILTTPLSIASGGTDATDEVTFATATAVSGDVISVHYGTINGSDQWTWRLNASTTF